MKILITGATGFIGRNLVARLLHTHEVHVIARIGSNVSFEEKRVSVFRYDGNVETLIAYFEQERFDGVVHLASLFLAAHTPADIPELIRSNVQFGAELLEASKVGGPKWFMNTGTYWQNYHNEMYNPVNLYAATKEAFNTIARYYTETSELIFTTIKLNDTFGPNDSRNKVFNLWAKIAKSGELLEMSAGEQIIDISYIEDIISAYALLIDHLGREGAGQFKNKTFGVSSNERMSLKELATLFEEATGNILNIKWGGRPYREREVMVPWENAEPVPGWRPKYTLKEAIMKSIGENG